AGLFCIGSCSGSDHDLDGTTSRGHRRSGLCVVLWSTMSACRSRVLVLRCQTVLAAELGFLLSAVENGHSHLVAICVPPGCRDCDGSVVDHAESLGTRTAC